MSSPARPGAAGSDRNRPGENPPDRNRPGEDPADRNRPGEDPAGEDPADRRAVVGGRSAELAAGLRAVRDRIEAGCAAAGRDPAGVTLVVVTKTYPADDVRLLAGLGVRDVGENRDTEAAPKQEACADLGLRWHFVGQLQSNKARRVARYADLVHSVDRLSLPPALGRGAVEHGRELEVLLQVSLDGDPARGGALPADLPRLADAVAGQPGLRLRGLMAVAPRGADPVVSFSLLPRLRERLCRDHPGADLLSAGMSRDLEAALTQGATHLRVGTAVLGARPPLA